MMFSSRIGARVVPFGATVKHNRLPQMTSLWLQAGEKMRFDIGQREPSGRLHFELLALQDVHFASRALGWQPSTLILMHDH